MFALKDKGTYYEYDLTSKGDFIESEVTFLTSSIPVLLCVVLSCMIAAYSVISVFIILVRLKGIFEKHMHEYLKKNRRFAKAKKEILDKNDETKKQVVTTKSSGRMIKILNMGLFTTSFSRINVSYSDMDEKKLDSILKEKKKPSFSFFKTPALYFDYLRRSRVNSFKEFLDTIYESPQHFPEWKLNSTDGWEVTSVRLDKLDIRYREFCTKEGYKSLEISKEEKTIRKYNIEIIWKMDSKTDAYIRIRWKATSEKLSKYQNSKKHRDEHFIDEDKGSNSLVFQFLESECVATHFDSDFILITELKERYSRYWIDNKISGLSVINIVGSSEIDLFGAKHYQNMLIPFMSGIAFKRIPGIDLDFYLPNIVRIPRYTDARENKTSFMSKASTTIWYYTFSRSGILTNLCMVVIHLLILLLIPCLILVAWTWCLLQINIINEDIFATTYTMNDVFNSSSYDFWLDSLPLPTLFWIILALGGVFVVIGFIELISFYATGSRDTGKYIVDKTLLKRIIIFVFWIMLLLFIAIYVAYLSVILSWCILGAVISPEKLLPLATGAAVLVVFTYTIYSRLKKINEGLQEAVDSAIDEELKVVFSNFVSKPLKQITKSSRESLDNFNEAIFYKAVNACLSRNGFTRIDKESTDAILDGNMGELLNLLHESCGIHQNIALTLIGSLKQDKIIILDGINRLASELHINSELSSIICEIILDKYNPYSPGINKVTGKILLTFKKLFKRVCPTFPLEAADMLLQVVLEQDPQPLEKFINILGIPNNVYKIWVAIAKKEDEKIFLLLKDLWEEILPEHYKFLFLALHSVWKVEPKGALTELATCLAVEHEFLVSILIACIKSEGDSSRQALYRAIDDIFKVMATKGVVIPHAKIRKVNNYFLSMSVLFRKSYLDMFNFVTEYGIDMDPEEAQVFYEACRGSLGHGEIKSNGLRTILKNKNKAILEFCNLWYDRETDVSGIAERLNVNPEDEEILHAILHFAISTSLHYIKIVPKLKNGSGELKEEDKLKMANIIVQNDIANRLEVLYAKRALQLQKRSLFTYDTEFKIQQDLIEKTVKTEIK